MDPAVVLDEDAPGPPISVPDSGDTGEGGKIKMIIQLVRKCFGVADIAAMRLSLPASLLEPIPNLEFSQYLDRPDMFTAINDSDDPFERMLAVLRFTFSKDLKIVHGKLCKPYNSVLGEHFRAHWDITPTTHSRERSQPSTPSASITPIGPSTPIHPTSLTPDNGSIKSSRSSKSTRSAFSTFSKLGKSPSTAATSPHLLTQADNLGAQVSNLSLANGDSHGSSMRVAYLTEQVSHHPPVSAYFGWCPARSIELCGIDQISAKLSGTALRVSPGQYNQGIFVNITDGPGKGERYHITHPTAAINGILRGSFYATIGDSTIITCSGGNHGPKKFRTILEYKEEAWLGKPHFIVEGVIHVVHEGDTLYEQWTKVKHVPHSHVVAVFDGSWRGLIRWRRVGLGSYPHISSASSSPSPSHTNLSRPSLDMSKSASKADIVRHDEDYATLLDLSVLQVMPKEVRPLEKQLPYESRKLWAVVTDRLLKKDYSEATKQKIGIEQRQRDEAAERKRKGVEFVPRYFEKDISKGYAALTTEGWAAIEEELVEQTSFSIQGTEGAGLSS